ncbi:hypothetical protein RJ639_024573 [Escallonia herrerae]|uniref:Retrotransposon gag domain-containing protein n=1 Tax=Escallonia herrerae TaxID=1293975 RepID=A0AA89AEC7_9ASTE|nr:hypothetical protein RJ639_024573 [Escallonia herrerae]
MLKDEANQLWKATKRVKADEVANMEWDGFKELFLKNYFPQTIKEQIENDMIQLTQGSREHLDEPQYYEGNEYEAARVAHYEVCLSS